MSEIRTPPSLKWLIDKHARLLGELAKFDKSHLDRITLAEKEVEKAEAALIEARRQLAFEKVIESDAARSLRADLEAIDRALGLHDIQINPEIIPKIQTQDAKRTLPHGAITRSIYECLKKANGRPVTTTEITMFIAVRYSVTQIDEIFDSLRNAVRSRAKNLRLEGKLERLHPGQGNSESIWKKPGGDADYSHLSNSSPLQLSLPMDTLPVASPPL
jgi:hypothetical protein